MDFKQWEERRNNLPGIVEKKDHTKTIYYKDGKPVATVEISGNVHIEDMDALGILNEDVIIDKKFLDSSAMIREEILDRESLTMARRKAVQEREDFYNEYKKAVFEDLNISLDHPKAQKLWELGLSHGYDYGLGRIYEEVQEMSELLS